MSRLYELELITKGADPDKVKAVFEKVWGVGDTWVGKTTFHIAGKGSLCAGESEEEAHERIAILIRKVCRGAKVRTRWTYLEELPFDEFGDAFDE